MKTAEELNALKNELESVNKKLAELTDKELEQVTGGAAPYLAPCTPLSVTSRMGLAYTGSDGELPVSSRLTHL